MSQEEKIEQIIEHFEKIQKPGNLLKTWLPIIILSFQFILGAWYLSRYTYKIEEYIQQSENERIELREDLDVVIDYMEDSAGYNHKNYKRLIEWQKNWKEYQKKKGTRGANNEAVKELLAKKKPGNNLD